MTTSTYRRARAWPLAAAALLAGCEPTRVMSLVFDQAPAIEVEAGESVNLSVTTDAEPDADWFVVWSADCGQVMGMLRRGSYVAPDVAGDCAVTASSAADASVSATLAVQVTPPVGGGATRWTRHVASDLDDAVRRVAATSDGGLVALVETSGDLGGEPLGDLDVVVVRFDAEGEPLWTRKLATPTREFAGGLAVDADGSILVVGTTWGALGAEPVGESDAFLARLSPAGEIVDIVQYGTARADSAQAVAIAANGDVVVVGWTEGGLDGASRGGPDGYVRRFTSEGEVVWTRQVGGAGIDFAIGLALDGDDAVLVGTTDGQVGATSAGGMDWYLARIGGDGALISVVQRGAATDDRAYDVASLPGGGVVVAVAQGADGFVTALDAAGEVLWTHPVATEGEDIVQALAVDPGGDVVAVGFSTGDVGTPNVGFFDAFVVRLDGDGAPRWTRRIGTAADDYAWSVAVLADGDVVVGGRTDGALAGGGGMGGDGFLRRIGP